MTEAGVANADKPRVALVSVAALTLLVSPIETMMHELGGHAAACLALNGKATELGAYYIDCVSPDDLSRRLVSMAGTGIDFVLFGVLLLAWCFARGDLLRLALWYGFVVKGMTAFGYWIFSGASGLGDWGPDGDGGIAPLPNALLIRGVMLAVGVAGYIGIIVLGRRTLREMIGGGPDAFVVRRRIAIGFYAVNGILAVIISLLNPHGFVITLVSAVASTFGGPAGMFNIAYNRTQPPPKPFHLGPSIPLVVAGVVVAGAFAAVLGPTIRP